MNTMFGKLIQRICDGVESNKVLWSRPDAQLAAVHQSGYLNALLDVLSLMGHDVTVECGEPKNDESMFINITIDGTDLVSDGKVNTAARNWLIAANQKED